MKGWMVQTETSEGAVIVFADNRNEAKKMAIGHDVLDDARYIDLRAKRVPEIDGMEDCEPKDNYWDNGEIRKIMCKEYAWACVEPWHEDCDKCAARDVCYYPADWGGRQ